MPREIKPDEHRVAITPDGVREVGVHGVPVLIEAGAGADSSFPDEDYARRRRRGRRLGRRGVGAGRADLQGQGAAGERVRLLPARTSSIFTYLHLAAYPGVADALLEHKVTGVAYETVEVGDGSSRSSPP